MVLACRLIAVVFFSTAIVLSLANVGPAVDAHPVPEGPVDFSRDVLPILSNRCFKCHGPDEATRKGGLDLGRRESALAALRSGDRAIVPGDSTAGTLIERLRAGDDDRMPPTSEGARLTEVEIDTIERWIQNDAPYAKHWSFEPPQTSVAPYADDSWVTNSVDAWILAGLRDHGLEPSPMASPAALIRRVALDLTGLPPTREQVQRFVASPKNETYDRIVDELLTSSAFGERWASVWLDLARYADTKGYEKDGRRVIWPYRDWVIRAFNDDMPFDRFTVEQLAGDLLPSATIDQLVATAFHRNTMTNDEGGTDDEEFRVAAVVDRVNTTMSVWMGLTAACAQCHTHKYDPITHHEYYALFDLLNQTADSDRPDERPTVRVATTDQREELRAIEQRIKELEAEATRGEAEALRNRSGWEQELSKRDPGASTEVLEGRFLFDAGDGAIPGAQAHGDAVTFVPGVDGQALRLAGPSFVDCGAIGDFERSDPFSYGGWMWLEGDRVHVPMAKMDNENGHRGWDIYISGRLAYVHLIHEWPARTVRVVTRDKLPTGRWFHLFVTYDGSSKVSGLNVYLNGQRLDVDRTHDTLDGTMRTDKPLRLGRRHSTAEFHGRLDDVRLYRRQLTADDVGALVLDTASVVVAVPTAERGADRSTLLDDLFSVHAIPPELRAEKEALAKARERRRTLESQLPSIPILRAVAPEKSRETRIMVRGNFLDLGDRVEPGVPAALHPLPPERSPDRLAFAEWLASPDNPLTARVFVNRVWEQLFGRGLVLTSEDFGVQGSRPTHPELLDALARGFLRDGQSVKRLLRKIVRSSTYRQSSNVSAEQLAADPNNIWCGRGARFRLRAEAIRDQALAVSGLLNSGMYGPPVMPPQPAGIWQMVYSGDRWKDATGGDRYRRALYTFWRRTSPYPSATTFDAPSREFCVPRRIRTNTPLQALITLNDPVYFEAAQALADRGLEGEGEPADIAAAMFERALLRTAKPTEVRGLLHLFDSELAHFRSTPAAAKEVRTLPVPMSPAVDLATRAAWTVVASVILNLDEFLTKG